jgi:hypothetical protein
VAGLSACFGMAVWLTYEVWTPGLVINPDGPRHFLRFEVMRELFLPAGHVDGWSPYWYLGAQQFLFQSYGYFVVMALFHHAAEAVVAVSSGVPGLDWLTALAEPVVVFKLFWVLPIVLLPVAVWFLARGCGLSTAASLFAGFLSLAFGTYTGFGMKGIFGMGLLLQGPGVLGVALAWPLFIDGIGDRNRRLYLAIVVAAAVMMTHFISGAYFLAATGIYSAGVSWKRRDARVLINYALFATAVILLSGPSLFRAIELRQLMGGSVGWGRSQSLSRLLDGSLLGPPVLCYMAYAGCLIAIAGRAPRLFALGLLSVGTALVATAPPVDLELPLVGNLTRSVFQPRSLPFVCLLMPVFAAYAVEWVAQRSWPRMMQRPALGPLSWLVPLVLAVVMAASAGNALVNLRRQARTEGHIADNRRINFEQTMEWLRSQAESPAIVAFEPQVFPASKIGTKKLSSLLNVYTGLYSLHGDQVELTRAYTQRTFNTQRFLAMSTEKAAAELNRKGVSYLLVRSRALKRKLRGAEPFERVFVSGPVKVYRLDGPYRWLQGPGLRVSDEVLAPEKMSWRVHNGYRRNISAHMPLTYHPFWQVSLDGEDVQVTRTRGGLVGFTIPAGSFKVEANYVRSWHEDLYTAVSAITLLVVGLLISGGLVVGRVWRVPGPGRQAQ